jgi:membrane-bound serine protease (ClpP class)
MTVLGIVLLVIGAVLLVAELHVASGVLLGGAAVSLVVGWAVLIIALGGSAVVAVPVGVGIGGFIALRGARLTRDAVRMSHGPISSGREAMSGRIGLVRSWHGATGRIFIEGALWRASCDSFEQAPAEGDPVVVEGVHGLTLSVRPAENWELIR